jgi:hypothetical protein
VFYSGDAKGVAVVMEAHAIVADPQPELGRFMAMMMQSERRGRTRPV